MLLSELEAVRTEIVRIGACFKEVNISCQLTTLVHPTLSLLEHLDMWS